jgi:hypothetical protein
MCFGILKAIHIEVVLLVFRKVGVMMACTALAYYKQESVAAYTACSTMLMASCFSSLR